jgi:hypothetical protein
MPNYCYQTLVISGEKDDLAPFVNKLLASWHTYEDDLTKGQCELLQTFYPMPDDIYLGNFDLSDPETSALKGEKADDQHASVAAWTLGQIKLAKKKYGDISWLGYFWRIDNWGSKWADFCTSIDEQDETHIKLRFETAWAPILQGILFISNDYPLLTFLLDFFDEMYNYPDGRVVVKNGEILSQWEESKGTYEKNLAEMIGIPVEGKPES